MKKLEVVFGDRVPLENRLTDCLELIIHRMHGDDDFNDTETVVAKLNNPGAVATVVVFNLLAIQCKENSVHEGCPLYEANKMDRMSYRDQVQELRQKLKDFLVSKFGDITEQGIDTAIDFMNSIVGADKSSEGCGVYAQVTEVELFGYNDEGVKFFVTLEHD